MKIYLVSICLVLTSLSRIKAQDIAPYSDPDNKGGWKLVESVSDEFEGDSLDPMKWNILGLNGNYYGEWKGRAPSQFSAANVSVGGGNLTITSKWEPSFKFSDQPLKGKPYGKPAPITTGCVITKSKFKYGYMEMRCKAADGPISSSFWTTGKGGEIDVFEHYGQKPNNVYSSNRFHTSFHDWRKGSPKFGKRIWTNDHHLDFRVADDFHVYGLDWDPGYVKMYVDGRLVNCVTKQEMGDKWVAVNEQKIWIDSEQFDWEVKPEKLKASDFGDGQRFVADYCRVWQRTGASLGCESRTNLIANGGFEEGMGAWQGTAAKSADSQAGNSAAMLDAKGQLEQTVTVKPDTTYILSGWGKSPNTNEKDRWFNCFLGVKDFGGSQTDTRYFFPYYQQKSLQFKTGPKAKKATVFFNNGPQGNLAMIDEIQLVEAPSPRGAEKK